MLKTIDLNSFNSEEQKNINQKIDFAFTRLATTLALEDKIFYFFFPFGKTTGFVSNEYEKNQRKSFSSLGSAKKEKERRFYALLGILCYLMILMIIGVFSF
ncbi:hypothetical protein [uncultured Lacinutrix sp.]|uniref:hypothetical protein n=1 Tax=uncultured Lacinutrix sp. TaxID=574032 RepID=UPI0026308499|nr:hypothetical protein [uncultured Lacinutrix sp.]